MNEESKLEEALKWAGYCKDARAERLAEEIKSLRAELAASCDGCDAEARAERAEAEARVINDKYNSCKDELTEARTGETIALARAEKAELAYNGELRRSANMEKALRKAEAECQEQARLNGMGSEREAKLMAERDQARAEVARVKELARTLHVHEVYDWSRGPIPTGIPMPQICKECNFTMQALLGTDDGWLSRQIAEARRPLVEALNHVIAEEGHINCEICEKALKGAGR